jgi:hypothetical protein
MHCEHFPDMLHKTARLEILVTFLRTFHAEIRAGSRVKRWQGGFGWFRFFLC